MPIFNKVLRAGEGKRIKELERLAEAVNALEDEVEALSDDEPRRELSGSAIV